MLAPPRAVLAAFGVESEVVALPGGEGVTFRGGHIVLKRVHDTAEAEWTQDLVARIDPDGFRVANPIRTTGGTWVHDRWSATEFVPGLEPVAPRWTKVIEFGLRFGDAAERARSDDSTALDKRTHRWAIADRVAWAEADVTLSPEATEVRLALAGLLMPDPTNEHHFVHGDLTGNVFVDAHSRPVVLDVAPYLRHRRWAAAVVIADAVLWNGVDVSLARTFAATAQDRDLLGRALIFRLVAEQLAARPRHGGVLEPYRAVHTALR